MKGKKNIPWRIQREWPVPFAHIESSHIFTRDNRCQSSWDFDDDGNIPNQTEMPIRSKGGFLNIFNFLFRLRIIFVEFHHVDLPLGST